MKPEDTRGGPDFTFALAGTPSDNAEAKNIDPFQNHLLRKYDRKRFLIQYYLNRSSELTVFVVRMKPEDTRDNGAERAFKIEETRGATVELETNGMSTTQNIFIFALLNRISTKHCALSAKMYTRVHAILLKMQFALNALAKLNQQNHSSREKRFSTIIPGVFRLHTDY